MKVVVRSSSLVFVLVNMLLGLPIRRRALRNSRVGREGPDGRENNFLAGGGGQLFGWRVLPPQQENGAAEPVAK
ncbi:MAG: hypothetical protein M3O20_11730 [Acidobacteriota bacterium]|nr:hypothetical protein [Acidobacteriota bacterium]